MYRDYYELKYYAKLLSKERDQSSLLKRAAVTLIDYNRLLKHLFKRFSIRIFVQSSFRPSSPDNVISFFRSTHTL